MGSAGRELDLAATPQLSAPVEELRAAGFAELVIDLRAVSFIDVAGLRWLVGLVDRAGREGWQLVVVISGGAQVARLITDTSHALMLPPTPAP